MPENEAFLQAILDDPEDDTLRLVYADWLEERGDPRGEFIRVQCQLSRLTPDAPNRGELLLREYELLAQWEPVWAGPLIGQVKRWRFRRGFVEQVKLLLDQFLAGAETLFRLAPVRELQIKHHGPVSLDRFASSPLLDRVSRLDLEWSEIGNAGVQALAASPHLGRLAHLGLRHTGVVVAGLQALAASANLPNLTSLDLAGNELDDRAVEAFVAGCRLPELCRLDFSNDHISFAGMQALATSPVAGQLTVLRFWSNRLGDDGLLLLASSPSLGRLEELDLGDNGITPKGIRGLVSQTNLRRLARLDLRHNKIGDFGAGYLASDSVPWRLAHLGLESNNIGWRGVRALAASPAVASLTSLDLSGNNIGNAGLRSLASSPHLRQLARLDAYSCGVTGAGAKALLASPLAERLRHLNLESNRIGPQAFQQLRARLGNALQHELMDEGYSLEQAVAHVKAHPPRCLRRFALRSDTDITRKILTAVTHLPDGWVAFELGHRDAIQQPVLLGYPGDPDDPPQNFLSPIAVQWEPCGGVQEVIDCERHGYDGEQDANCTITCDGLRQSWRCPDRFCRDHIFVACFSYHDEPPVRDADCYFPLQDQFQWFVLAAYCRQRDQVVTIADFECS